MIYGTILLVILTVAAVEAELGVEVGLNAGPMLAFVFELVVLILLPH